MGLKDEMSEMRKSMEKMTLELHETNLAIRESLQLTSDTIKQMNESFTKMLGETLKAMQDMKVKVDISDTIYNRLGIDGLIPDIFKKKTKK
jgi:methyl-accepting chemotaxis protein